MYFAPIDTIPYHNKKTEIRNSEIANSHLRNTLLVYDCSLTNTLDKHQKNMVH